MKLAVSYKAGKILVPGNRQLKVKSFQNPYRKIEQLTLMKIETLFPGGQIYKGQNGSDLPSGE
jgi:hypothetical protein